VPLFYLHAVLVEFAAYDNLDRPRRKLDIPRP
jgi:hypothetical protein